jgi:hypothetical protein
MSGTGAQYKRDHPDATRAYNQRSNAQRPNRDRGASCWCERPRSHKKGANGLCDLHRQRNWEDASDA